MLRSCHPPRAQRPTRPTSWRPLGALPAASSSTRSRCILAIRHTSASFAVETCSFWGNCGASRYVYSFMTGCSVTHFRRLDTFFVFTKLFTLTNRMQILVLYFLFLALHNYTWTNESVSNTIDNIRFCGFYGREELPGSGPDETYGNRF